MKVARVSSFPRASHPISHHRTGSTSGRQRLTEIDSLRGIAAISVLLFHYSVIYPGMFPTQRSINIPFEVGAYGVFLFFAISGFVISLTLKATPTILDFAVKRCARLFPLYWVAIAFTTCAVQLAGVESLQVAAPAVLINLTMLQGFFLVSSVDGVYWTLTVELAFYVCAAAIWFRLGFRRLELVTLCWLLVSLVAHLSNLMPYRLQMLLITQYNGFFVLGMLAYRVWVGDRCWIQQLPYAVTAILTLYLVQGSELAIVALLIQIILFAVISGRLTILRHAALQYLGALSYALYLVHHHAGFVMLVRLDQAGIPPWPAFLLTGCTMMLVAALLHHIIELPAERRIRSWWKSRNGFSASDCRQSS